MINRMKGILVVGAVFVLALSPAVIMAQDKKKTWDHEPEMRIDPEKVYVARIDTTAGPIVAELYPKQAPHHVNSFVFLAKQGFYDGVIFHRVIPGFMIQGGGEGRRQGRGQDAEEVTAPVPSRGPPCHPEPSEGSLVSCAIDERSFAALSSTFAVMRPGSPRESGFSQRFCFRGHAGTSA